MIDPIRLELIKNALVMVSDNMMVSVLRTSRSTLIKSNMDFSASILDGDGNMVAQGLALPAHLAEQVALEPLAMGLLARHGGAATTGAVWQEPTARQPLTRHAADELATVTCVAGPAAKEPLSLLKRCLTTVMKESCPL